jgi:hypothetical protein
MQTNNHGSPDKPALAAMGAKTGIIDSVFDLNVDDVERLKKKKPKSLGIVCHRADCKRDLHCFNPSASKLRFSAGRCQTCGVELVDWNSTHLRDLRDVGETFEYLKKEWIRHFFFHVPITSRIESYARHRRMKGLSEVLERQLRHGKMLRFDPKFDWQQTAMLRGTIVHWARHATACCCRRCMKYWHNIPFDQELTNDNIEYFKQLGLRYIELRLPTLSALSEKKPVVSERIA